ncbi:peptidoglycan-binding domain-containing protein [Polyangium jinanense]|uniref:Peptidoglycan-binding protein n=1 Tax=Polyangium jinanense TaxID=2829994 RepID=A0A9X3XDU4_9BACT|nr:peptidoglycan-binding domain-containing protein [Polyangium jinanense]MDC3959532.1 peptidoglycan-binding protein [Polyangium jinanense]MDC3986131.1 peptidoglycan-binding protein [Polyangium jinanense]
MNENESNAGDGTLVSPELAEDAMLVAVAAGQATLERGVKSGTVVLLQKALVELGASLTPDGSFGPKTHTAIVAEQAAAGLPQTGVLDAATLVVIDRRLATQRKGRLHDAMAAAVGGAPARPAAAAQVAGGPSRQDQGYFDDAAELRGPGAGPVADPDSPPPVQAQAGTKKGPLPSDRAGSLDAVRRAIGDDGPANAALERLLAAGRLHEGSLLPNLATFAQTPRNPALLLEAGIEPELLLGQVIRHVDNPLRVQQGQGHGTCGAGVMEYVLLRRDPAELVRIVDGITREARAITLRSGKKLEMPRSAIARDNSGRVDLDRLFQSAIMNHASAMSWLFDYDNPEDNDTFWAAVRGNSQMAVYGFTSLYQAILGGSYSSVSTLSRPKDEVATLVATSAARGVPVPVILEFRTYHWLSVEWLEAGKDGKPASIVLRNPWGKDEGGDKPPRVAMPEGGGRVRMKYADFIENVFGATVRG